MVICSQCGKECKPDGCGTGYGENIKGEKICYDCCGKNDYESLANLKVGEKTAYYLSKKNGNYTVTNWPGTMRINVHCSEGFHNIAGVRRDVHFSYKGHNFWGVQYGDDSEICYIKRIKD